jgi:protoporphyrinogen oxidase
MRLVAKCPPRFFLRRLYLRFMAKTAIIIGAGPAGLTAAFELLERTDIQPIILEKSGDIGGLSKTVNYKGNRMDIGGHRFFSKSDRVMDWWLRLMPLENSSDAPFTITYQKRSREIRPQTSGSNPPGSSPAAPPVNPPVNPPSVTSLRPTRLRTLHTYSGN